VNTNYSRSIGDVNGVAIKKVGIPGWIPYRWQAADGGDCIVHGCIPGGVFTRGPRKGQYNFAHKTQERIIVVTHDEVQAAAVAYETETGNCWDCKGTGQEFAGWSVKEGTKTRPCRRCNGTGKIEKEIVTIPA